MAIYQQTLVWVRKGGQKPGLTDSAFPTRPCAAASSEMGCRCLDSRSRLDVLSHCLWNWLGTCPDSYCSIALVTIFLAIPYHRPICGSFVCMKHTDSGSGTEMTTQTCWKNNPPGAATTLASAMLPGSSQWIGSYTGAVSKFRTKISSKRH